MKESARWTASMGVTKSGVRGTLRQSNRGCTAAMSFMRPDQFVAAPGRARLQGARECVRERRVCGRVWVVEEGERGRIEERERRETERESEEATGKTDRARVLPLFPSVSLSLALFLCPSALALLS